MYINLFLLRLLLAGKDAREQGAAGLPSSEPAGHPDDGPHERGGAAANIDIQVHRKSNYRVIGFSFSATVWLVSR